VGKAPPPAPPDHIFASPISPAKSADMHYLEKQIMSNEWTIKAEEKKKLSASISSSAYETLEEMKNFISSESNGVDVSDAQALELIIKIASKNRSFSKWKKSDSSISV
jgi:hypothetical protein